MQLTDLETRVLGCLIEKAATTPEQYPLTTRALMSACNQRTNREPVTDYTEREVLDGMLELRAHGLCRSMSSGRSDKHKHVLEEAMGLTTHQQAALAIMLLRGPQTPGEIRTRTERYVAFDSVEDVEVVLGSLANRDQPLAVDLGRGPGQSQDRWMHLLAGEPDVNALAMASAGSSAPSSGPSRTARIDELETAVAALTERLERLESELGLAAPATTRDHEPTNDDPFS